MRVLLFEGMVDFTVAGLHVPSLNRHRAAASVRNCKCNVEARALSAREDLVQVAGRKPDPLGKGSLRFAGFAKVRTKMFHTDKFAKCELIVKAKCSLSAILSLDGLVAMFAL